MSGNAEQRLAVAARQCSVGRARRVHGAIEIAHADRVDLAVVALDAADRVPSVSSTDETFFAFSAAVTSTAVLKLHGDLAKARTPACFCSGRFL